MPASITYLLVGMTALIAILIILWKKKYRLSYLFFFSIFWIYLLFVFGAIIFPIHPLPEIYSFRLRTNFIPFYFGACYIPRLCLRNIIGNILLTIPLGFGISFVAQLKSRNFLWLAILAGTVFETLQLVLGLTFRSSFRVIDINDVILNGLGVGAGYLLFRLFGFFYLFITKSFEMHRMPFFVYVHEVVRRSE